MIKFNAIPLEKYSSLHELPLLRLLGIKSRKSPCIKMAFNFNLQTPMQDQTKAQVTFSVRESDTKNPVDSDFCIKNLVRWRLNLSDYESFTDFLKKIKRKNYSSYRRTLKTFDNYGATISFIEEDWTHYADTAFQLYQNVAQKHGAQLYDLNFFRMIAKLEKYKLLCAWFNGSLIGVLVLIDEGSVFHSMVCGFDYNYTKKSHTYSRLHYEFIRLAFEEKKYTIADIGLTADSAKALMDFQPVMTCMDISVRNRLIKRLLRLLSRFVTSTINEESKLELKFHFTRGFGTMITPS
jgi:hypothetical protein